MEHFSTGAVQPASSGTAGNQGALVVVTILFFMWGLLTSLNDVLIPHLKEIYTLSYVQAMLVQFCFFGAYLVASVPAGMLVKHIGYQRGAVAGLLIAATGCALFYPAATSGYALFLFAFFVLACGITLLQVAANPYVTVLGEARTASSRLTLTQAFNALGTTIAPLLGGMLILAASVPIVADIAAMNEAQQAQYRAAQAASVQGPYLVLAATLLGLAVLFACARLPRIAEAPAADGGAAGGALRDHPHLLFGVAAIFLYVGGEVSIGSFLINFIGEPAVAGLAPADAAHYVSYYWGGAMLGRFLGFAIIGRVSPGKALAFNAACSIALIVTAIHASGALAFWAIIAVGLCNSIMFPVIFSMALHRLGPLTGRGSGLLCMAIVGGAVVPFGQGYLADTIGVQYSFWVPAACYAYLLFFGLRFANLYKID